MSLTASEIGLYAAALFLLFLTPGPVWVAMLARGLKGGFAGAWPLALGVAFGDVAWAVAALLTLNQMASFHTDLVFWLKYVAVFVFVAIGVSLLRSKIETITLPNQLTRLGMLAGLFAGIIVILGNPKAILFYIGILPGFFTVATLQPIDIAVIGGLSALVPFLGNLVLALMFDHVSKMLNSLALRRRINRITGVVLICVGGLIFIS
ncbi:LysE family translocator [Alphaproteobacteria bacterium]|nr:LysE family translocator [Alphaproteobacteria bacterium]